MIKNERMSQNSILLARNPRVLVRELAQISIFEICGALSSTVCPEAMPASTRHFMGTGAIPVKVQKFIFAPQGTQRETLLFSVNSVSSVVHSQVSQNEGFHPKRV